MLLNKALYKLYYTLINYILYYYSVFKIKNYSFKNKKLSLLIKEENNYGIFYCG